MQYQRERIAVFPVRSLIRRFNKQKSCGNFFRIQRQLRVLNIRPSLMSKTVPYHSCSGHLLKGLNNLEKFMDGLRSPVEKQTVETPPIAGRWNHMPPNKLSSTVLATVDATLDRNLIYN